MQVLDKEGKRKKRCHISYNAVVVANGALVFFSRIWDIFQDNVNIFFIETYIYFSIDKHIITCF